MKYFIYTFIIIFVCGCCHKKDSTEIYHISRNNVVDVSKYVNEIEFDEPIISGNNRLFLINNLLMILDAKADDKQLHIFDKKSLKYVNSIVQLGIAPHEVTTIGHVAYDKSRNSILVTDHSQLKILSYNLDSALSCQNYTPKLKISLKEKIFPDEYIHLADTLCIGKMIIPDGNNTFNQTIAKWNMCNGQIADFGYKHPKIDKLRVGFDVSDKLNKYVLAHHYNDLITICSLNGNLVHNIYGPNWEEEIKKGEKQLYYWGKVKFLKDKIIGSYSGEKYNTRDYRPNKLVVFDSNGNYIVTLNIGYNINDFCYDEDNGRLLFSFDDEIQFGYIDLKSINEIEL